MAVQWSTPELADRFAAYVEELRDFFVSSHIHYGSANDVPVLLARLEEDASFREDLTSLVRSIILRQGGVIPRAQLLEIVAVAIGGHDLDQPSPNLQRFLHSLLLFLNSVAAKPWNQPPGEARLQQERFAAVVREMPAPAARTEAPPPEEVVEAPIETKEVAAQEVHAEDVPVPERPMYPSEVAMEADSPSIRSAGESYAGMLAARHKVVPITIGREAMMTNAEPLPVAAARSEPLAAPAATISSAGQSSAPFPRAAGVFSRLAHVEREADTAPGPNNAPVPGPIPNPIPPPQPPPALAGGRVTGFEQHLPTTATGPVHNAAARIATESTTATPLPSATPAPQPRVAAMSLPGLSALESFFAGVTLPKMPRISIPKLTLPKMELPRFTMPRFSIPKLAASRPNAERVESEAQSPHRGLVPAPTEVPAPQKASPLGLIRQLHPVPVFLAVLAAAGVSVFAAGRLLSPYLQSHSTGQTRAQTNVQPPAPSAATPVETASAPAPTPLPAPSTAAPSKPTAYSSAKYDDYVASPYSRSASGELAAIRRPAAAAPTPAGAVAGTSRQQPPNVRTASLAGSAPIHTSARPLDPDSTYVGAPASERAADTSPPRARIRPRVSSRVMRSNLVSAPAPGYPLLAKITHMQGEVVVQAVVARDGTVTDAIALRGHHLLRGAAVDAVRQWRYRPYMIDGYPAEVSTTVTVDFPFTSKPVSQ